MHDGAFGLSTGLDYPPGCYATTDELQRKATAAAKKSLQLKIIGTNALYFNTTGSNNVAAGNGALLFNQTGSFNSAARAGSDPLAVTVKLSAAARAVGSGDGRILWRHVLPNCLAPVLVQSTLFFATAILSAAYLGFLGLGAQPPTPEWGAMIAEGRQFLLLAWWMTTLPGLALLVVGVALSLIGDGLAENRGG